MPESFKKMSESAATRTMPLFSFRTVGSRGAQEEKAKGKRQKVKNRASGKLTFFEIKKIGRLPVGLAGLMFEEKAIFRVNGFRFARHRQTIKFFSMKKCMLLALMAFLSAAVFARKNQYFL